MKKQSKFYHLYRFNDGTRYKVEIGKDGVSEESMRKLRRVNNRETKINGKIDQLESISIEAIISGEDKHSILTDECVDTAILIETADEYETLHKAIEKLLPHQQDLLQRIYFQDQKPSVIADELGITKQAVNDRLQKIYTRLKKLL